MSLSNRTSLDTDVVFLRNIFMFSTNTNNVPVSTNFILAAGQYGQIGAVDTLRNIETYGVGYLPCTFSTFNGQMLSISSNVASSFVNSNQLFSVQNYLISTISSTNADLNAFSSYVINELVPSTVSGITWVLSSLNSSFQGYVVGTSVTQSQLFSTTDGLILNTGNQISSYSTIDGTALTNLSNYLVTNGANNVAFSNLSTYVSTFAASTNFALISTGQNFTALSNYVRLTTASNSTYLAEISATVSELIDEVNLLSSITTNPLYTIGIQSTLADVRFGSNISISSINSNYKFGISTFTGPSIFMSSATFSSLSAASGFVNSFAAITISSSVLLTSSIQAQQLALNRGGSNYTLDVGGDVNFSGTLYQNGVIYPATAVPVNVLGTLSTTANVWFGSNIMVSSINSNLYLSNGQLGIGAYPTTFPLEVTGTAQISFSVLTDNVSTGYILGGQMSSVQIYTSSLRANGIITDNLEIPVLNTTTVNATTANTFTVNSDNVSTGYILAGEVSSQQMYTSSLRALQVAIGTLGSNYALDVGGSINFTGSMYQNGVIYPAGGSGTVNVLGTLSTTANVWFGSNIMVSSINSNYQFRVSTFTGPSIFMSSATFSTVSAATGYISSFGASVISTTRVVAEQLSSMQLFTSSIVANSISSPVLLASSLRAQQVTVAGNAFVANNFAVGSNAVTTTNVLYVDDATNRVGINCNAPTSDLTVLGTGLVTSNFAAGINGANNVLYVDDTNNNVGVNCNAPGSALTVNGAGYFENTTLFRNGLTAGTSGNPLITVKANIAAGLNQIQINGNGSGASNIILDVGGGALFQSSISTLYTTQSEPRVWSYYNSGTLGCNSPFTNVTYDTSNYEASNIASPQSGGVFTTPYTGTYKISFSCQSLGNSAFAGLAVQLYAPTAIRIQSNAVNVGASAIAITAITYITSPNTIIVKYETVLTMEMRNPQLTIEYLG